MLSVERIIAEVCLRRRGITPTDITAPGRSGVPAPLYRMEAIYRAYTETNFEVTFIARHFNISSSNILRIANKYASLMGHSKPERASQKRLFV